MTRRTLVQSVVWTVPVVALATAAPAAAASAVTFTLEFSATLVTTGGGLGLGTGEDYELTYPAELIFTNGPTAIPAGGSLSIDLFWDSALGAEISPSTTSSYVLNVSPPAPFGTLIIPTPISPGQVIAIPLTWSVTSENWANVRALLSAGQSAPVTASLSYGGHFDDAATTITGEIIVAP